ncbi:MAG: DUF1015 domain-containing protein [Planctomycetota bacterium]|jgi:uncharacterized protein (DUF1015 family)
MMEIKAFKAYRYNKDVVGNTGSCIAPPYDVINGKQRESLYARNQYNIVRIIKGKEEPADDRVKNQYSRAAGYLNDWIKKGALKQDAEEAIYAYVQDFKVGGVAYQRENFIALAKLEDFGQIVRPHEQTLDESKIDRMKLQKATNAGFGLVFMLYSDSESIAERIIEKTTGGKALIDFVDEQEVRHRLFAVMGREDVTAITKMMAEKSCIIADGHHRYETSLQYAKETPNPAARYKMLAFANTQQDGLIVLATHRLVGELEDFDIKELMTGLEQDFEITEYAFDCGETKSRARGGMLGRMKAEQAKDKNAFGIYAGDDFFRVAVLKDKGVMDSAAPEKSRPWRSLDVSVLHKLILERHLGIDEMKLAGGGYVWYVKDTDTAVDDSIAQVDSGGKQAAFFTNPVKLKQIEDVTSAGEKMPQKSTYFFPKIFTGLTINKL